jgi:EpsI family protein
MTRRLTLWTTAVVLLVAGRAAPTMWAPAPSPPWHWEGLPACVPAARSADQWQPRIVNADRYLDATYRCEGVVVSAHVADFFGQHPGKEAVGGANEVAHASRREPVPKRNEDSGIGFDVNAYRLTNSRGEDVTIWQWYVVDGQPVASDRRAKLAEAWHLLAFDPAPSSQFLLAVIGPRAEAEPVLRQAASSLWTAYLEQRP